MVCDASLSPPSVDRVPGGRVALYKLRVGAMAEAVKLYQEIGFPALQKGSHDKKLVGYRHDAAR